MHKWGLGNSSAVGIVRDAKAKDKHDDELLESSREECRTLAGKHCSNKQVASMHAA